MALSTNTQTNSNGVMNRAVGKIVTDAAAAAIVTIPLGFEPRYFKLINLTDRISDEWFEGMASASSVHTIAVGTVTLELVNGVAVSGKNVTLTAATMLASKTYAWVAEG